MEGSGSLSVCLGYLNQEGRWCQKVVGRGILQFILGTKEAEKRRPPFQDIDSLRVPCAHVTWSLPAALKGRAKRGLMMLTEDL